MKLFSSKFSKNKEVLNILYDSNNIKIETIYSDKHIKTNNFISDRDEFVYLKKGKADIIYNKKIINLKKGQYIIINKNTTHYVKTYKKCIWLTFYF